MASRSNPIRQAGNKPVVGRGNIGPAAKPVGKNAGTSKPAPASRPEVKKGAPAPAKPSAGRRNPEPAKAGAKKEQTRPIPKRDDRVDLRGKPADKPTGKPAVRGTAAAQPKAPGRTNPPQKPKASAPSATARPAARPAPTAGPTPTPSVGVPRGVGPTGPVTGARPIPLPLGVQAQRPAGPRKAPSPSTPGYNPGFPRM